MNIKKIIRESAGVSFDARSWTPIILGEIEKTPNTRIIIDGQDYAEQYEKFSVDYFVIDFNDWTNGYLDETSGYDKDGNYVVHIMVLNRFTNDPYMSTIINHELKHAYQDWQRQKKGYSGIGQAKESKELYTDDFVKIIKDRIDVGKFFKKILQYYYLLSDLEINAFMENVYDKDTMNDYRKLIYKIMETDIMKLAYYNDPDEMEQNWATLKSANLPFIKKYDNYTSFLSKSSKYFKKRSEEVIRKINKLEYVHRDR